MTDTMSSLSLHPPSPTLSISTTFSLQPLAPFSCPRPAPFSVGLTPRLLLFTSELHPLASAQTALVAFSISFGICFAGVVATTDGVTASVVAAKDRLYAQAWTLWSQSIGVLFGPPIAGEYFVP